MSGSVIRRGLLWLAIVIFLPAAAMAQDRLISNVFFDTDLRQALEDVAAQAGVNIIVDPGVSGLVTVEMAEVTLDKALELLLAGTEFQVQETPDYYLVFTPDETAGMFPGVAETRLVRVHHVPAETARTMLPNPLQRYVRIDRDANVLAVTAPSALLDRILSDLADIDVPSLEETIFVQLDHVRAATARTLLPQSLQRFVRTDEDRNTLAITAPAGAQASIMDHLAQLDVPLRPGSVGFPDVHRTHVIKLDHASAEATLALLPNQLHDYVRADAESNTLAVSAPDSLLGGIMADIGAIDVPRKHVMLDARVVVLERGDLLDFGAEWQWPRLTAGTVVSDVVSWPWELRIGYTPGREFTNALNLTLNLLSSNQEATIIASPQVLAQDGREAEIRVTTEEWFQITSEVGTFLRADLREIETGTILGITPRIGRKGDLTLDMEIEVSDVVARGAQNLPVVSRRTARSTVQIKSGGTAAIAGLVDTRSQLTRAGVPGISNIPLLGHAFRTDALNHQARQVAVFVTATIVGDHPGHAKPAKGPSKGGSHHQRASAQPVSEAAFRQELEAALNRLEAGPQ